MSQIRADGFSLKDEDDDASFQMLVGDVKRLTQLVRPVYSFLTPAMADAGVIAGNGDNLSGLPDNDGNSHNGVSGGDDPTAATNIYNAISLAITNVNNPVYRSITQVGGSGSLTYNEAITYSTSPNTGIGSSSTLLDTYTIPSSGIYLIDLSANYITGTIAGTVREHYLNIWLEVASGGTQFPNDPEIFFRVYDTTKCPATYSSPFLASALMTTTAGDVFSLYGQAFTGNTVGATASTSSQWLWCFTKVAST